MNNTYDKKSVYLIINKISDYALEIPEEEFKNKSEVELGPINQNNPKQLWIISEMTEGSFEIVNGFPDKVLAEEHGALIVKPGSLNVKHEQWKLHFVDLNYCTLSLNNEKGQYLANESASIILKQYVDRKDADLWELRKVTKNKRLAETCFLINDNLMIDVPGSSLKENTEVLVYNANYRFNQRWNILRAGEVYIIKSFISKLNLDVSGGNYEDGKIIQYHSNGGLNQFWRFQLLSEENKQYRIYVWENTDYELGHNGKKLKLYKGKKFAWRIEGYIPE